MACEKYSGWMTSAALGALGARDEAELRAHAAGCGACRREWDAMHSLVAAVDRGVEAMVAGEPSPQFTARLRARIAEEPAPGARAFFTWPRITMVASAAAAVLLAVLLVRAPERGWQPSPVAVSTPAQIEPQMSAKPKATQEPAASAGLAVPHHRIARAQSQPASFSMEVLVPRGQISAALVLSEGVSAGQIDGAQLSQLAEQSAEPLAVKALVVAPLESPLAGPARETAPPEGGRD